ncbi:MAG TPA: hypothetical protein PLZ08_10015 [Bacillota bacterium]|jgi:hypothetical protein|nr:hypothetical protein [Bacillota bacterium]HOL10536.1 hypothetical protein [Bacillota bacterium]HPO98272.1 hypothetical protein [Bacillota bacterium]
MRIQNNSAAIISYEYSIEVSPTILNICSYLTEQNWVVDIYVDSLRRYPNLALKKTNIINQKSPNDSSQSKTKSFIDSIKTKINHYNIIFAVDFLALNIINQLNADLSKVVFLSLEGIDYLAFFDKTYAAKTISNCGLITVQSVERGETISKYLNTAIDFEYLPVALRPLKSFEITKVKTKPFRIIYSGYFAEWSCLTKLLNELKNCPSFKNYELVLHGHSMGTDYYVESIKNIIREIPNVRLDTNYYNDSNYYQMLRSFNLGLALYQSPSISGNFDNLIFSSGKIASYLWNGLAVITNIDHELTHQPPFLFIKEINELNLQNAFQQYEANPTDFSAKALYLASEKYNFDRYMKPIYQKILNIIN